MLQGQFLISFFHFLPGGVGFEPQNSKWFPSPFGIAGERAPASVGQLLLLCLSPSVLESSTQCGLSPPTSKSRQAAIPPAGPFRFWAFAFVLLSCSLSQVLTSMYLV